MLLYFWSNDMKLYDDLWKIMFQISETVLHLRMRKKLSRLLNFCELNFCLLICRKSIKKELLIIFLSDILSESLLILMYCVIIWLSLMYSWIRLWNNDLIILRLVIMRGLLLRSSWTRWRILGEAQKILRFT